MNRIFLLACILIPFLLPGADREPGTIPLDRGKKDDKALSDKKKQALRDQTKRTGKPVGDRPASDRSTLKLPSAIINIEDRSRMDISRGRGNGSLIPTIDRTNRVREGQPGDFRDRTDDGKSGGKDTPGGRTGDARTLSQMEILYGSYHSLGAFVMTGLERKLFSYQVSFRRNRDEGFDKNGSRVASSSAGGDDLLLDIGWSRDRFESGVSLRFTEQTTGLQGNTNYSQLRNTGIRLDWKGSYIFSSAGSFKFSLGFLGLRYVLDNPAAQSTVNAYGGDLSIGADFNWANRSFLKIRASMLFQNADSNDADNAKLTDPALSVEGGFGLGPFTVTLGTALHVPGIETPQIVPRAKMEIHFGRGFFLYALAERRLAWLDQSRMLAQTPYVGYSPVEDPEDSLRFGGGGKLKLGPFVLDFSLFYINYSRLFVPQLRSDNLYEFVAVNPGMLELTGEARVFLYKSLSLRFRYVQRILDETVPYLPELLFSTGLEFRIPGIRTVITATGRFEGNRNNGDLDPYFLLDLALRQPIVKGLSAVLVFRNLLDADYRQREFYAEPGFSMHLGMSLRF